METALNLYHVNIKDVKKSKEWFDHQIRNMQKSMLSPAAMLRSGGKTKLVSTLVPTGLYAYQYMPKGAKTLPYYDMFPLVFPINKNADTFTGLNMHYLDYPLRFALFRELQKVGQATKLNDMTKMQLHWSVIQGMSKLAPAQACIKQYLFDHVKSPFMKIHPNDWATAMLLPTHKFAKASAQTVWQESAKKRSW